MINVICLIENWSPKNTIESIKQYILMRTELLEEMQDLTVTTIAVKSIFQTTNEYAIDPANKYARDITLDMFGKLLNVHGVGDGSQANCKNLSDFIETVNFSY